MLGVARGSKEDGGLGPRGSRAGIANISGEEFSINTRGFSGRVVVNLRRSNIWRHKIIDCVGNGGNSRGGRRVEKGEGAGRHPSDEELDEDTGEEGNKDVNQ